MEERDRENLGKRAKRGREGEQMEAVEQGGGSKSCMKPGHLEKEVRQKEERGS